VQGPTERGIAAQEQAQLILGRRHRRHQVAVQRFGNRSGAESGGMDELSQISVLPFVIAWRSSGWLSAFRAA
jgi:hypothetical protein